jgi:hypothetical protein
VLALRPCLGDDDRVVTVVVAVRGRSPDALDIAAADEEGSFPVSSNFRILDFRSSSSSHTVDGAVVDNVDSVPSSRDLSDSSLARPAPSKLGVGRLLRVAERFDGLYARDVA